jgi:putative nucleotidyltransferase with HDIG domain
MEEPVPHELRRGARVDALFAKLEAYDRSTAAHSHATALWCRRIAAHIGMTVQERDFVGLAGLLHDIGKIATPGAILLKPGPLDVREWEIIRSHPAQGALMLEEIPELRHVAPIVRAHHERHDGEGYPDRLHGASIPLAARIVAVADAYHSMISQRVYRKPFSVPQAAGVLRDGRGTQWDAPIVDALLACVHSSDSRGQRLRAAVGG